MIGRIKNFEIINQSKIGGGKQKSKTTPSSSVER